MGSEAIAVNRTPSDPFSFEDPLFGGVDTTRRREDVPLEDEWYDPGFVTQSRPNKSRLLNDLATLAGEEDSDLLDARSILDAEAAAVTPVPTPVPVVAQVVAPVVIADEPETIEYEDGSSVTIEKSAKGWSATLDPNNGSGVEIFRGKSKDEMWKNLAAGKLNANKKIRDLNRQIKLGIPETVQPTPVAAVSHQLTADEVFEIKTQLNNNPDLAFEKWFQKRTGMTIEQLVAMADKGKQADEKLNVETEARGFRIDYPEYYPTDENLQALDDYLVKHKKEWTRQNLGVAFEELSEAGLLDVAPRTRTPQPVVVTPPAPVAATPVAEVVPTPAAPVIPPVPDPRIVARRTGPRAGFGIPASTATADTTVSDQPLPDEELDDLSNEQISDLFAGVRRLRAQQSSRR